jgi:hypothetical protein
LTRTVDVEQYVERNFPDLFPETKRRFRIYINSLLQSDGVVSLMDSIAAHTDPNLESELAVSGGESLFLMPGELHPLARKYRDLRFQTVIAYSRYFKDRTLFEMIANWFLGGDAEVRYGNIASWPVARTMDEPNKAFDQGYTMDMYVQGLAAVTFRMFYSLDSRVPGDSFESLVSSIDKVYDLLILVTPARTPVIFNTIPTYYVGAAPYKFEVVSGGLYVEGAGVSSNPNRPFYLENAKEKVNLIYEGDLSVENEGGGIFINSDVFSVGMEAVSHPFEDPVQLSIIADLDAEELGNPDGGYYASVASDVVSPYWVLSREGRRLTLLLEGPTPISRVVLFSEHPALADIVLEFNPALMYRYIRGPFPLYGVRVLIDFS